MDTLFDKQNAMLRATSMEIVRNFMHSVNWKAPMLCIRGSRGVGKSTLLRQYIKLNFEEGSEEALYCSMDWVYFSQHGMLEVAEKFYKRAVDAYDCLAQTEPDTYEAELADACLDLGLLYVQLERFDEAMQMCDQSLNLKEHLAKKNPEVYEPILGHDLWHLGSVCERMYDPKRMRELFERALSIYERLNEKYDGRYSSCINYFRSVLNHRD